MLHHPMIHAYSLFEAIVVLLGGLLGSKSYSVVFLVRERHLYLSLDHREALSLFPLHACQILFVPSFLRGFCQFSH